VIPVKSGFKQVRRADTRDERAIGNGDGGGANQPAIDLRFPKAVLGLAPPSNRPSTTSSNLGMEKTGRKKM
jgi:hypothetical protein